MAMEALAEHKGGTAQTVIGNWLINLFHTSFRRFCDH
jgi:hypothetical protein